MSMARVNRFILSTAMEKETTLGGHAISYRVRRSPRAKYVRLEVSPQTGLTVVIPGSYHIATLPGLLKRKTRWILSKLAKFGNVSLPFFSKDIEHGDSLPYLGRNLRLVIQRNGGKADAIRVEGKRILVSVNPTGARLNLAIEGWYRREAEKLIKKKVDELCSNIGVRFHRLTIRGAKTRWGSCSPKGNLNFNWKLLMVPEPVIDYVIVHELAHLKEMNHSKRFWNLVARHCPRWREHRKWLQDHEAELSAKLAG